MNLIHATTLLLVTHFGQTSATTSGSQFMSIISRDSNQRPINESFHLSLSSFDYTNREEKHVPIKASINTSSDKSLTKTHNSQDHRLFQTSSLISKPGNSNFHQPLNRVRQSRGFTAKRSTTPRYLYDLSFVPKLKNNNRKIRASTTKSSDLIGYQNSINSDTQGIKLEFNSARINELQGVFDEKLPLSEKNFRRIPPRQIAFIPPKIVYDTRILPAPFNSADTNSFQLRFLTLQRPSLQTPQSIDTEDNDKERVTEQRRDKIPINEDLQENISSAFVNPVTLSRNSELRVSEYSNRKYISNEGPLSHTNVNVINDLQSVNQPDTIDETEEDIEGDNSADLDGYEYDQLDSEKDEEQYSNLFNSKHQDSKKNERIYSRYAGKYMFGYRVTDHESGNDFGHEERRDGEFTSGRYHVLLPDGRIQNVNYHVDGTGYHASVSYRPDRSH